MLAGNEIGLLHSVRARQYLVLIYPLKNRGRGYLELNTLHKERSAFAPTYILASLQQEKFSHKVLLKSVCTPFLYLLVQP